MINWIKKHKLETISLALILFVALFLRLYRIDGYMTYLGDEGRDVRIVRDLISKGNLVFIGPQTSVGNMYLGPMYYYMMAPALLLANFNPVGPAIMIALLGVLTIFVTWYITREWFGKVAAFITALIFAISPVAIIYSRSSWNPNPMPFFALITIYGIYTAWQKKHYHWLPIIGFTFAAALQMHYLGLLLAPTILIIWLLSLKETKGSQKNKDSFIKKSLVGIGIFLVTMSPLLLFDLKHSWLNFKAFTALIFGGQGSINSAGIFNRIFSVSTLVSKDLFFGNQNLTQVILLLIPLIISILFFVKNIKKPAVKIIGLWLVVGILGLGLYKNDVYIHYLGFLYPAVYILIGALFSCMLRENKFPKGFAIILLLALIYSNIINSPQRFTPNYQMKRTENVVDLVINKSSNQPFNFALIAKQNYDESYRYFLENKDAKMLPGDKKLADQLFVVCEDGDSCKPEGNSKYEVAIFGIAKVVDQWSVDNIKIYKMVHP